MGLRPTGTRGSGDADAPSGWPRRVAWLVAIWGLSVAAVGLVSYGLRLWIGPG